ncbi:ankyrin [Periconia macrospinosa]|uniref:Ankyrin n=1 Tax=Periconia macrospinosa TaxID=97972 RepID=A0A2V1D0U7_9PLEO|nr:ankyrin [Periconia macrospinosa]
MSFGYSVGDVIKTVELAREVRKRFVDAPAQYKAIGSDVKNLSRVVEEIDDVLPHRKLSTHQEQQLRERRKDCEDVLEKLKDILDESVPLGSSKNAIKSGRMRVAWMRLRWDQKGIQELRDRLHLSIDGLNLFLQNLTSEKVYEIGKQIEKIDLREEEHEKERKRKRILDFFSTFDHTSSQQDIFRKRNPQTGEWILQSNEFSEFETGKMKTLLCHGMPGAGKTIISSIVVDHILQTCRKNQTIGACYFYFRYDSTREQTLEVVTGSLLRQLLEWKMDIPEEIGNWVEEHKKEQRTPNWRELMQCLHLAAKEFGEVFVVLDALDEYYAGEASRFFELFDGLRGWQEKASVRLFATTRINTEIISHFEPCLRNEIRAHDDDIRIYINSRMHELRKIKNNAELKAMVVKKIVEVTGGMFLLARLHMDSLKEPATLGSFKKLLCNLPKGAKRLNESYDEAMRRIDAQSEERQQLAYQIISWTAYTHRTFTTNELLDVLAVASDPQASDFDKDMRPDVEDIDSLCAGLVAVDTNARHVRLVHETTLEYFKDVNIIPNAHAEIMRVCLSILSYPKSLIDYDTLFRKRLENYSGITLSLFRYAAVFWSTHAREASGMQDEVLRFLLNPIAVSVCMRQRKSWPWTSNANGLGIHLAAYLGLEDFVRSLIQQGQAFDAIDGDGRTPLVYASMSGSAEVVHTLLSPHIQTALKEAQIEDGHFTDSLYWNTQKQILLEIYLALKEAVMGGHLPIVQKLIRVDGFEEFVRTKTHDELVINTQAHYSYTDPIYWAVSSNHPDIVEFFLETWVLWYDSSFPTWATKSLGRSLENGTDGVFTSIVGRRKRHRSIQKALCDLSNPTKDKTSLGLKLTKLLSGKKISKNWEMSISLLLENEFEEATGTELGLFFNILSSAHLEIIKQFSKRVIDHPAFQPSSPDFLRAVLASQEVEHGTQVLKFLFDTFVLDPCACLKESDIGYFDTLLERSIYNGAVSLFNQLLMTSGIMKDGPGKWIVLRAAMTAGYELEKHSPVVFLWNDPRRPHALSRQPGIKIVEDLLYGKYGMDLNIRDELGQTPLIWTVGIGFNYVAFLYARVHVDVNARDGRGLTALMHASWKFGSLFEELDINESAKKLYETPLFSLLQIPEIDIALTDNRGQTALWWAIHGLEELYLSDCSIHVLEMQMTGIERIRQRAYVICEEKAVQLATEKLNHHRNFQEYEDFPMGLRRVTMIRLYQKVLDVLLNRPIQY